MPIDTANIVNSPSPSTRILLLGIWAHLKKRRRIQFLLLLLVMIASGLAELMSLGAVIPFLAVLSDPEILWNQPLAHAISKSLGFKQAAELLLPATLVFGFAAVLAAIIRLLNLWLNGRFAGSVGSELSCEAYKRTLYQPYGVHMQRNTSSVITATTTHVAGTVAALTAFLQLITAALVSAGLLFGLLLIDWEVAVGAMALFGTTYWLLAVSTRDELRRNSDIMAASARKQLQALQEGLGAIRDVLLNSNQKAYVEIYRQADMPQRQTQARNLFLSSFPRYAVEALGLLAISLFGGLLVLKQGTGVYVIPLLGALALGAQRLLPALQQVYSCWSYIKACNSSLEGVLSMLSQPLPFQSCFSEPLAINHSIHLKEVSFRYAPELPPVLTHFDLQIKRGERIGIIGSTGSGKSTAVDLLMGLLAPSSGKLLVDGVDLHDPNAPHLLDAWRAAIAHVPQTIFLADSSIAENIAFGISQHKIDLDLVKQAAQSAQIAQFIESSPKGYNTFVGERGIRLSGGQRQRIGIARALYKRAEILVLDEATSALDGATEKLLISALNDLSPSLTVIMIAHRLSTLYNCDRIIKLDRGLVVLDGSPAQVLL